MYMLLGLRTREVCCPLEMRCLCLPETFWSLITGTVRVPKLASQRGLFSAQRGKRK